MAIEILMPALSPTAFPPLPPRKRGSVGAGQGQWIPAFAGMTGRVQDIVKSR